MNLFLNVLLFALFGWWFWNQRIVKGKKYFFGIILLYLVASIMAFLLSLYSQNEYLDGLQYLLNGGISISIFWLSATVVITWKNLKERTAQRMFMDLVQIIPLLLTPLMIWLMISNMSFKIGG